MPTHCVPAHGMQTNAVCTICHVVSGMTVPRGVRVRRVPSRICKSESELSFIKYIPY